MTGRPRVKISRQTRETVRRLASYGVRNDYVAAELGLSLSTMKRRCAAELRAGHAHANALVAGKAYRMALSGNTTMLIFWLKTQLGWKEKDVDEVLGREGGSIAVDVADVRGRIARRIAKLGAGDNGAAP